MFQSSAPAIHESYVLKPAFELKAVEMERSRAPHKSMKSHKQAKRAAKSLDLWSSRLPADSLARSMARDFSFNASKLGIAGDALPADMPPSPLSSRVELPIHFKDDEKPRSKGWLYYLTPSWSRAQHTLDEDSQDGAEQRSRSRMASSSVSRREQRSSSHPDTNLSTPYVPARFGQFPYRPSQDGTMPQSEPRARSLSLDVPRLARKSFTTLRAKKTLPAKKVNDEATAPQLRHITFSQDGLFSKWNGPGMEMSLQDLPRESTSSSESDYSYDRRHSISGSSGHDGLHARARGGSDGSYASTAPSTVTDTAVMSAFSVSDSQESNEDGDDESEDDDYEDDIEWETPSRRLTCVSPTFEQTPSSPTTSLYHSRASFQTRQERPQMPSFASYSMSPSKKASSKPSLGASMLKFPRRMASASSLGGKSAESGRSSFSERARRSFSQARSLLTVSPPRAVAGRRSTADDAAGRPAAVFLQPIHTGVISRPCQTTPNPVGSSRSNSMTMTFSTTNTIEGSSVRYPSFYLGTSSESGSVTGGSSGNSSGGGSWESTAPELAALEELVLTECKYLADLQLLLDVYVEGLRKLDLMTPASIEKILSNLDEVMAFSRFLIDTVRAFMPRRMSPPTSISSQPDTSDTSGMHQPARPVKLVMEEPDYLGLSSKLVKELPARMDVYARYCLSHQGAKERLAFERDLRPSVAAFIELTRSTNPTLQGMDMAQFLVLPVQRVTRYPLLFGCLAKECGKRRNSDDVLREDDEDPEVARRTEQRLERADAIHANWVRLRDVSTSICGLTNLAVSYQQSPARPDTTRSRPRPSMSPQMMSSPIQTVAQFGTMHMATPPPPALVSREEASGPRPAFAAASMEQSDKSRTGSFSLGSWRRASTKATETKMTPSTWSSTTGAATPTSASSSNGASTSLLSRFVNAFKHPPQ